MDRKLYILVFCLLSFSAAVFCPVAAEAPLDDAYYWPEPIEQTTPTIPTTPTAPADTVTNDKRLTTNEALTGPIIEYTNVQDTTVTVKIHR